MTEVPPSAPAPAYAAPAAVPGKTLGVVALILAFFVQLIALILGLVALSQSRKVGAKNTPAVVAIVLSIIFGLGWIAIGGAVVAGGFALFGQCAELGQGIHEIGNGTTITCG